MTARQSDHLHRLVARLPGPVRSGLAWVLRPEAKWLRIPLGLLFIAGGFLGFLPILGFWMLPLGALLLAEDFPWCAGQLFAPSRRWNTGGRSVVMQQEKSNTSSTNPDLPMVVSQSSAGAPRTAILCCCGELRGLLLAPAVGACIGAGAQWLVLAKLTSALART